MEDKEKILRWDLQEAEKELKNSDNLEVPLVSISFAVLESRRKKVTECEVKLKNYLTEK